MTLLEPPRFCPRCGRPLEGVAPPLRCAAPGCGYAWYADPKVGTGVVVDDGEGRILLVRRNHEPRLGRWAFPSGYVDAGEVVETAAVREVREETGVEVEVGEVLTVDDERVWGTAPSGRDEELHAIGMVYAATVVGRPGPLVTEVGGTTDAVAWVPVAEIESGAVPVVPLVRSALGARRA